MIRFGYLVFLKKMLVMKTWQMTVVLALLSDKSNFYFQSDGAVLFGSDTHHLKVDRLWRYQESPNTSWVSGFVSLSLGLWLKVSCLILDMYDIVQHPALIPKCKVFVYLGLAMFLSGRAETCWKHDWLFHLFQNIGHSFPQIKFTCSQGLSEISGFTGISASPFEASFDDPLEGLKQQRCHGRNGHYVDVATVKMVVDGNDHKTPETPI